VAITNLEEIAEGDPHARWVVANHVGNGKERPRCTICDAWWPCDLVSLAALAVLHADTVKRLTEAGNECSAYIYAMQNPGEPPIFVRQAMRVFEEAKRHD
jgi:hypothetical protein